jgi:hypothetical protein
MRNAALATAAAIVLSAALATAARCEEPTFQMEEQDCQGDAMRLCGPEIPDREKIRACLVYYKDQISPACRSLVAPER